MHIAIEGMDGVGKTSTCRLLSKKIKFQFIEKPLHYLFDSENSFDNYLRIRDYVNLQENRHFTAWFYGLGNIFLYHKFGIEDIITDRHLVSNYVWSGNETSEVVFDCLTTILKNPDCTFILHANDEVLKERLKMRDKNDPDIVKIRFNNKIIKKMEQFLLKNNMKYYKIDTSHLTLEEVVDRIVGILRKEELI
ncbi:MAG: AAA family ATPase [Candidatus Lokiarchaeota archaeon]|nr:AAA family ATPase [Candidatus Lokiarchaeota archaeon]